MEPLWHVLHNLLEGPQWDWVPDAHSSNLHSSLASFCSLLYSFQVLPEITSQINYLHTPPPTHTHKLNVFQPKWHQQQAVILVQTDQQPALIDTLEAGAGLEHQRDSQDLNPLILMLLILVSPAVFHSVPVDNAYFITATRDLSDWMLLRKVPQVWECTCSYL